MPTCASSPVRAQPRTLCFVDPRHFGSWRLVPESGPCVVSEGQAFRENVLESLDGRAFDKPICEVLLNQQYFNGMGITCVEILYRILAMLSKKVKLRQENPDLLELCHTVPMEVIVAEKQLFDPEHSDNYAAFENWLQSYLVPGMSSLRDRSGRTIWL